VCYYLERERERENEGEGEGGGGGFACVIGFWEMEYGVVFEFFWCGRG
jgi:hypothetical protein